MPILIEAQKKDSVTQVLSKLKATKMRPQPRLRSATLLVLQVPGDDESTDTVTSGRQTHAQYCDVVQRRILARHGPTDDDTTVLATAILRLKFVYVIAISI